jgi:Gas vesicle synthesis protein GvpO
MSEHEDGDFRTAAKAAAATAAVGAAVGVARAIAARAEQSSHHDDDEPERRDEPEQREEPVSVAVHDQDDESDDDERDEPAEEQQPVQGTSVDRLRRLTDRARDLLQELSGSDVESVSAIDRTRDGFRITLEAVEVRRVPESTDVLATYDVELDGDGDLVRYERRRRYARSQSDNGGGA